MAAVLKTGWSKPSTLLFACEIPANEKAFAYALAQAKEFEAELVIFHAYDTLVVAASENSGIRYYDYAAAALAEKQHLDPLAERARAAGIRCEVVVRPGLAADQILGYMRERQVDRVVMGTHSPGPIGKLLVGSVAEAVLRSAKVPVYIVGPDVVDGSYRGYETRTVLCALSDHPSNRMVAQFAARVAAQHHARLVLEHVIRPQERDEVLHEATVEVIEARMVAMVPEELRVQVLPQAIVVTGDPTEELLYQAKAQQADVLVLGAQGATAFAAVTRHGVVYKVLAHSHCPVMTLSPVVLAEFGMPVEREHHAEEYLAGVI